MDRGAKALVIDDDEDIHLIMDHHLAAKGFVVEKACSGEDGLSYIQSNSDVDVVFLDQNLPGADGLDILGRIKDLDNTVQVIMITAYATVPSAVSAIKKGACDYLTKPISREELELIAERALKISALEKENLLLKKRLRNVNSFSGIIAHSRGMREILDKIRKVAALDSTVTISGGSGTGKELLARAVHKESPRAAGPFIAVNCAALPEDLLTSSLFGYEKGAFTGAVRPNKGCFEEAEGGTLFLDEIGDMSPKLQSSLLRVLQEKEFCRLGSYKVIQSDFRLVTATNKDMEKEVKAGRFREDLYYRLNVVPISLPPLSERKEDIPPLVSHFISKCNKRLGSKVEACAEDAMDAMMKYSWPGNCREMENMIENILAVKHAGEIELNDLPEAVFSKNEAGAELPGSDIMIERYSVAKLRFERLFIRKALEECGGNISEVSRRTGIPRSNLYGKIKKHRLA